MKEPSKCCLPSQKFADIIRKFYGIFFLNFDCSALLGRPRELLRPSDEGAGEDEVDGEADHRELDGRALDPGLDGDHDDARPDLSTTFR